MDDGIDAIALLESERTILERAVRTAWREWAPEDLRTSLGPTPSLASILEKLDELREAESNPTTSSSTQRLDGPSPRRRPSAATLLANFVSEEVYQLIRIPRPD